MISKNKIKWIRSLENKKVRQESGLFIAEGNKLVEDILPYFPCELLVAKSSWMATQGNLSVRELIVAEEEDIVKASLLKNPQDVIGLFKQRDTPLRTEALTGELNLLLDGIQDPGNLGTIIRLADWFGIRHVICSPDTVDVYNPKVIQATMGAIARVHVYYCSLTSLLETGELNHLPVYGTFLDGRNIYEESLKSQGFIIMGNEGNGIGKKLEPFVKSRLYIPNYPSGTSSTESLNVAVATAIVCSEFRRQQVYTI